MSKLLTKLLKTGFALATLLLFATPASALTDVALDYLKINDLGYVGAGETMQFQHVFEPATDASIVVSSIDSAWLQIVIIDDWNCAGIGSCVNDWFFEAEVASIDLNSITWASGQATAAVFWGEVSAQADLLMNDGLLNVTVNSDRGDFVVYSSVLRTAYTYDMASIGTAGGGGAGVSPMPEPSAALVFAIGALVVQRRVRRGVRSR